MADRYYKFSDFDPSWTEEDARKHEDDSKGALCPFARWSYWHLVNDVGDEESRHEFLFYVIKICAHFDFPLPDWAANLYLDTLGKWERFESRTIDDALGLKRPSDADGLKSAALKYCRREKITNGIFNAIKNGRPVHVNTFNEIGPRIGLSGGGANRYFYSTENHGNIMRAALAASEEGLIVKVMNRVNKILKNIIKKHRKN